MTAGRDVRNDCMRGIVDRLRDVDGNDRTGRRLRAGLAPLERARVRIAIAAQRNLYGDEQVLAIVREDESHWCIADQDLGCDRTVSGARRAGFVDVERGERAGLLFGDEGVTVARGNRSVDRAAVVSGDVFDEAGDRIARRSFQRPFHVEQRYKRVVGNDERLAVAGDRRDRGLVLERNGALEAIAAVAAAKNRDTVGLRGIRGVERDEEGLFVGGRDRADRSAGNADVVDLPAAAARGRALWRRDRCLSCRRQENGRDHRFILPTARPPLHQTAVKTNCAAIRSNRADRPWRR